MTTKLANSASIDYRAVDSLIHHWIVRAGGRSDDDADSAAVYWAGLVDDCEAAKRIDSQLALAFGFQAGLRCATAVIADPLGDPTPEIIAALDAMKDSVDEAARLRAA